MVPNFRALFMYILLYVSDEFHIKLIVYCPEIWTVNDYFKPFFYGLDFSSGNMVHFPAEEICFREVDNGY